MAERDTQHDGDGVRTGVRGVGREELSTRWSGLHHGIDPGSMPLLSGYLRLMWAGGRVLDRAGVPPTAITVAGVGLAVAAVGLAEDHPAAATVAVVSAALCDSLDGATAVVGGRATRSGAIADAIADRVCDGAFAAVVWRRGAPGRAAAAAAGVAWGVDALRRVRRVPATVTVAERPSFTICAAMACASASFIRGRQGGTISAAVWIALGAVGIGQVLRAPAPA